MKKINLWAQFALFLTVFTLASAVPKDSHSPDPVIPGKWNDTNLALNKKAEQSSTAAGGEASRAVDGNTDGKFPNKSVSHTGDKESTPGWWQVDLGEEKSITSINVYNRTDCCKDRLKDYKVIISSTPFEKNTKIPEGAEVISMKETAGSPSKIAVNKKGRYVRIQLTATGPFSLAEVEVMGASK